jgi:hypothetical protein
MNSGGGATANRRTIPDTPGVCDVIGGIDDGPPVAGAVGEIQAGEGETLIPLKEDCPTGIFGAWHTEATIKGAQVSRQKSIHLIARESGAEIFGARAAEAARIDLNLH